jgi:hypothetical protein
MTHGCESNSILNTRTPEHLNTQPPACFIPPRSGYPSGGEWLDSERSAAKKERTVLWTIIGVLLLLWLVGLASSFTMGGLIHALLVIAVVTLVVDLLMGRRTPV